MDADSPSVGDVIRFERVQWQVAQRLELEDQVDLILERMAEVKASTPYGQPQRYKRQRITKRVNARRVQLVASQATMF